MLTIGSFDWRRLSPQGSIDYRVDDTGALLLRGGDPESPPMLAARIRDGHGGFGARSLESMGFVWTRAADGDGWLLRSSGRGAMMAHVESRWADLVRAAAEPRGIDERLVLTLIASESGDAAPDADGFVKAPRTERGYPQRSGETDVGGFDRDALDWQTSRGAHSSHGLLQTLIRTAVGARPDLFEGIDPSLYRTVLWDPSSSIACGVAYLASFKPSELLDPMAARVRYGAGSVRPENNPWGAHVYDDFVILAFIARWNDDACVRAGECAAPFELPNGIDAQKAPWVLVGLGCFALSTVASLYAARLLEASRRGVAS